MEVGGGEVQKNVFEFNESLGLSNELVWGDNKESVYRQLGLRKRPMIGVIKGRKILEDVKRVEQGDLSKDFFVEKNFGVNEVGEDKPRFSVLRGKGGKEFIEMEFSRVGMSVVMDENLERKMGVAAGLEVEVKGYRISHLLVKGENGQVLDMMSTLPKDREPEVFMTLSINGRVFDGINGGSGRYMGVGGEPAFLSLSFLQKTKEGAFFWSVKDMGIEFLHESGHHLLSLGGRRRNTIETERDTNALAILRARDINRKVGGVFFDVSKDGRLRRWIQEQLCVGYDEYLGSERPASTRVRNRMLKERREQKLKEVRFKLEELRKG